MADLTFTVRAKSETPARVRVSARNFEIVVDEPPALGGSDLGPNPVEVLLAALVGCLNVVAHLVAREHGIDVRDLEIEAGGPLNPARLMGQPTFDRTGFKTIEVRFRFKSDVPAEKIERWLAEVEARCPVSDNLAHPTPLSFRWEKKS